jgi:DNA-binding HxlR family transcriptional regulator
MEALVVALLGDGNKRFSELRRCSEGSSECSRSL